MELQQRQTNQHLSLTFKTCYRLMQSKPKNLVDFLADAFHTRLNATFAIKLDRS